MSKHKDTNMQFVYTDQDFATDVCRNGVKSPSSATRFDTIIQSGWRDKMEKGLFRFSLGDLQTRIMPGSHGYVAQLNVRRGTEKRKPQEILSIKQEFNTKHFNFNKINPDEIIFEMIKDTQGEAALDQKSKMVVLINVSPLEFGHCLFVPNPLQCIPQVLNKFTLQSGIESVLLSSDTGFRVGFNSLGGYASVNHLHLHGYYLDPEMRIESILLKTLVSEKGFYLLHDFPAGFVFYTESETVEEVAKTVCEVTDFLVGENIAHNLFLTRGCPPCDHTQDDTSISLRKGVRVCLWPRKSCFGAKEDSAFNVALCELAGHLPFKNQRDFELSTEHDVMEIVQKFLLPDQKFNTLQQQLIHLLTCS